MSDETAAAKAIRFFGKRLFSLGFTPANDGNLSCRLSDDHLLCTPTLVSKGALEEANLCTVNMTGHQLSGDRRCTSEIAMHLAIYRGEPDAKAVVHCHPPHVTAYAITHEEIPAGVLGEVELSLGVIPRAPFATPGSPAMGEVLGPFFGQANTVVLSNHGVVSWADSIERACWNVETLDAYCRILILAKQIGDVRPIPSEQLAALRALRAASRRA